MFNYILKFVDISIHATGILKLDQLMVYRMVVFKVNSMT